MEVENIRNIHKEYLKNYPTDSIVLNLKNLPNIEYCHIHKDGKGWGQYVKNNTIYYIGRNNHYTTQPYYKYNDRIQESASRVKQIFIIHDNPEVVRTYTNFINLEPNWWDKISILQMQHINPLLFANLYDYTYALNNARYNFPIIIKNLDNSTSSITKASGFSIKYFKALALHGWYHKELLKNFIKLNFSPKECCKYLSIRIIHQIPIKYKYNRRVLEKFYNLEYNEKYIYRDYLAILRELPEEVQKRISICPSNIQTAHDNVVLLYNNQLAIREQERNKLINEQYVKDVLPIVKKFEYEDDQYIISAPKLITELITEGKTLSHCVGTYMQSVSRGNEYILFLRTKSNPNVPYFTINITPERHIRQIHGKHNCHVTPELIPFIEKWKNKFNITGVYDKILCHL